ncbi:dienelactone hydrolase family protein [Archangium minus]|uniref:Dienelactone hydrolase family protein n=1 Tax=Archangium minus TaxID=83450 RepID=A0ABY9X935_9BACT|nr:dienelactone hydrolase family protein [Archangium violaceum]WNG51904.1 dienelactone hydrolase family protein [Archangium minus]
MHEVTTARIIYEADGLNMVAHLARPRGEGPWPAVLIGHDGVGLDDYQRSRADDIAAHGHIALAMDYHGGQTFFGRPDAMLARVMPLLADPGRMRAIGRAALDVLLSTPGVDADRLLALGYGAGGHVVLELARTGAPFQAIAVVHPSLPEPDARDWRDVNGTFLLCTGSEDPLCTPDQLLAFGRALQEAGVDWRVDIYGGAKHAFWARPTNPDGSPAEGLMHLEATVPGVGYHPKHTVRSWRAVLDLFAEDRGARRA